MKRIALAVALFVSMAAPAWAGFDEGLAAYTRGDHATAFREMKPLAEHGDTGAQWILGRIYELGYSVPQDYTEAVKWYRKAANRGFFGAQESLGLMYQKGRGVPQDYVQAHLWFNLSAAQGPCTTKSVTSSATLSGARRCASTSAHRSSSHPTIRWCSRATAYRTIC